MSIVKDLSLSTLSRLETELELVEQFSSSDMPFMKLSSPLSPSPVGEARVLKGKTGEKAVYIGLTVPAIHLDSHMIFCFTDKSSKVPHFTLDAVNAGPHYAFHLDLIPRLDLAANLDYIREVFEPLTPTFKKAHAIEGFSEAELSATQRAVMSSWMLAHRATEDSMDLVGSLCSEYLDHWLQIWKNGVSAKDTLNTDLATRDRQHRNILFSAEVDPVWGRIEQLLGKDQSEQLRSLLID